MPDFKTSFTRAQRVKRVGRRCLARITQRGARCTRNSGLQGGRVALQFVVDTNYRAGKPATTALCCHIHHPLGAHPREAHVKYVGQQISPFWRLYDLLERGWYE
jgi:hypothetical protein